MDSIHKRIKELRLALNLTQEQFASRLLIKRSTIANYENGRNIPVDSVKSLIYREFSVSQDWLERGLGSMFSPEPSVDLDRLVCSPSCALLHPRKHLIVCSLQRL